MGLVIFTHIVPTPFTHSHSSAPSVLSHISRAVTYCLRTNGANRAVFHLEPAPTLEVVNSVTILRMQSLYPTLPFATIYIQKYRTICHTVSHRLQSELSEKGRDEDHQRWHVMVMIWRRVVCGSAQGKAVTVILKLNLVSDHRERTSKQRPEDAMDVNEKDGDRDEDEVCMATSRQ
jgi:hypothetical protein